MCLISTTGRGTRLSGRLPKTRTMWDPSRVSLSPYKSSTWSPGVRSSMLMSSREWVETTINTVIIVGLPIMLEFVLCFNQNILLPKFTPTEIIFRFYSFIRSLRCQREHSKVLCTTTEVYPFLFSSYP